MCTYNGRSTDVILSLKQLGTKHFTRRYINLRSQLHICGSVTHLVQPLQQEVRQALSRTASRAKSALSWAVVMTTAGRKAILSCRFGGSDRPNHCLLLVYRWGATRSSSSDSATITFLSPRSTSTCSPTILVRLYYFKINSTCSRTILK